MTIILTLLVASIYPAWLIVHFLSTARRNAALEEWGRKLGLTPLSDEEIASFKTNLSKTVPFFSFARAMHMHCPLVFEQKEAGLPVWISDVSLCSLQYRKLRSSWEQTVAMIAWSGKDFPPFVIRPKSWRFLLRQAICDLTFYRKPPLDNQSDDGSKRPWSFLVRKGREGEIRDLYQALRATEPPGRVEVGEGWLIVYTPNRLIPMKDLSRWLAECRGWARELEEVLR